MSNNSTGASAWACNACGQVACACTLYNPGDLTPNAGKTSRPGRR